LRSSRDFARVFRTGRRSRSDGLTVFVAGPAEAGPARLGLSIRRAAGNAVERNRTKRRLRAAWRELPVAEGIDVVVKADRAAVDAAYQEMEKHLIQALGSAGALR
jgi:ribonuclease P protein component